MRRRGLLAVVGVCLVLSACHVSVHVGTGSGTTSGSSTGPRITGVVMATGYQNGKAVGETTVFPPNSTFHAVVTVSGTDSATKVKAAWTAVDAGGEQNHPIDQKEVTVPTDQAVDFTLSLPNPWPTGSYKVDISLNGNLDRTVDFTVQ